MGPTSNASADPVPPGSASEEKVMSLRSAHVAGPVLLVLATLTFQPLAGQTTYRTPPAPIAEILEQPPLPFPSVSPDGRRLLLQERATMPPIEDMAAPMLRLAGLRINPATNGPAAGGARITGYRVRTLEGGAETVVRVPDGALGMARWSPDGRRLTFART